MSDDNGCALCVAGEPARLGVRPMLAQPKLSGHPLRGVLRGTTGLIVDATAGFGADTAVCAGFGRSVLAIERSDVLHALLQDALIRLESDDLRKRISLAHADACALLRALPQSFSKPSVVLLDPMYPPRRHASALPPKPMQLLRLLHGEQDDDGALLSELFGAACAAAPQRIAVKRPPEAAPPANAGTPTFSIQTRLVRWDVWERSS